MTTLKPTFRNGKSNAIFFLVFSWFFAGFYLVLLVLVLKYGNVMISESKLYMKMS